MADRLMLAQACSAAIGLALCASSLAQALTDPTRPPLDLLTAAAPGGARKGAIISGRYVPLGGTYGKARLVGITATEVTLKSDQGLEVLQLYSTMEKTTEASGPKGKPKRAARLP